MDLLTMVWHGRRGSATGAYLLKMDDRHELADDGTTWSPWICDRHRSADDGGQGFADEGMIGMVTLNYGRAWSA
jgi:hypothetical protein